MTKDDFSNSNQPILDRTTEPTVYFTKKFSGTRDSVLSETNFI